MLYNMHKQKPTVVGASGSKKGFFIGKLHKQGQKQPFSISLKKYFAKLRGVFATFRPFLTSAVMKPINTYICHLDVLIKASTAIYAVPFDA